MQKNPNPRLLALEVFKLERLDTDYMTIAATCRECSATFELDLYTINLKTALEEHANTCPRRRNGKHNGAQRQGAQNKNEM